MYCPECGKSNPEGAKNCQYCNAELIETTGGSSKLPSNIEKYAQKAKDIDISNIKSTVKDVGARAKKKRKIIIPVSILAVVLVAAIAIIGYISSPKRVVNSYVKNLIAGDFDSLYNDIALPESDFITKEQFKKAMEERGSYIGGLSVASNFTVEEVDFTGTQTDKYFKNYNVAFLSNVTGTVINSFEVTAAKQDKNFLLIFPRYKVALDGLVCSNITVQLDAPSGCSVEIDGIALKDPTIQDPEDKVAIYTVDAIFSGKHTITVTGDLINAFEKEVNISRSDDTINIGEYDSFYLRNTAANNIIDIAAGDLQSMYNAAIAGKSFNDSGVSLASDNRNISEKYNNLASYAKKDNGEGLKSITFSNFRDKTLANTPEIEMYSNDICRVRLVYDYSYVKIEDKYDGLTEISSQNHSSDTFMEYAYENGSWKLRDMDYYMPSYYYD